MPGTAANDSADAAQEGQAAASVCQVCGERDSKYCCPRCDKKTCSLDCVKGATVPPLSPAVSLYFISIPPT